MIIFFNIVCIYFLNYCKFIFVQDLQIVQLSLLEKFKFKRFIRKNSYVDSMIFELKTLMLMPSNIGNKLTITEIIIFYIIPD